MKRILLVLGLILSTLGLSFANNTRDTHELVCAAPAQVAATSTEDGKMAKVAFSITGASSYIIEYRLGYDSTTTTRTVTPTSTNSIVIDGLKPCSWYVLRVKAVCSPNESSEWTKFIEFKTVGCVDICPKPAGLFASSRDSIASLNWLAISPNAGYSVMWRLKRGGDWKTETVTANTLILRGLKPCSEYEFKVKAMCGLIGSSEYSEAKSFKTLGCIAPCLTPKNLKGEGGEGKIALAWASTEARGYEVQYKEAGTEGVWISSRVTTPNTSITGLKPCTKYVFQVRSLCGNSTTAVVLFSEWSSQITIATTGCNTTTRCEPLRRLGFVATANGVTLKWEAIAGAKFEIQYKLQANADWKSVTTANTSHILNDLISCTTYQFRVRVLCSNGNTSGWSGVMAFKQRVVYQFVKYQRLSKHFQ